MIASSTHKILVGSFTDAIYTLEFDPASRTLKYLSQVHVGRNPSWIEAHPSQRLLVFAGIREPQEGLIAVVTYDENGKGRKINEATCSSGGADPCTLLVTEDELIVGNYTGGTLATIPISTSPPYTRPAELWTLAMPFDTLVPGRDLSRQEVAHPHQAVFNPLTSQRTPCPRSRVGQMWQLTKQGGHWAIRDSINVKTGGGPRHIVGYGNTLYILLELTSELAAYSFDSDRATFTHSTTTTTVTSSPAPSQMKAAEILIPKPNRTFPVPYIYVSNREDLHPEGDTIAIFSLEKGEDRPELVAEVRTGLRHLRGMAFGGEDDRWLIVGGTGKGAKSTLGGGIKVYGRVEGGRGLVQIAELDADVGSKIKPTAFLWL